MTLVDDVRTFDHYTLQGHALRGATDYLKGNRVRTLYYFAVMQRLPSDISLAMQSGDNLDNLRITERFFVTMGLELELKHQDLETVPSTSPPYHYSPHHKCLSLYCILVSELS